MAMEWLELKSTTKVKQKDGVKRSIIYRVMAPAGHNGTGTNGKHKLINPEAFLDNSIEEYGKKLVSEVFFKQFVVQAQSRPRVLMDSGAMDSTILGEMEKWKLNEQRRVDAKATEKIVMDRWMSEFNAATTIEEKMAVLQRMQQHHEELSAASGEEETNGDESEEEEEEEENGAPSIDASGNIVDTMQLGEGENGDQGESPGDGQEPDDSVRGPGGRFTRRPR